MADRIAKGKYYCPECEHIEKYDFEVCPECGYNTVTGQIEEKDIDNEDEIHD